MAKKLVEIASEIVQAQASIGQMSPSDIEQALLKTFVTLQKMQIAEEGGLVLAEGKSSEEVAPEEKVQERGNPQDSIKEDKVVCLECGAEMRQLTAKHLNSHDLSPREYKKKYGLALGTPLSAKSLTRARSRAAKKRGLPENLLKFQEQRRQQKADLQPTEIPVEGALDLDSGQEAAQEKAPRKKRQKKSVA